MIKMKVGGMILTGLAAFLVADKAIGGIRHSVGDLCEAAKWRGYYKCWSRGDAKGEPVPPGYSMTTRPDGANYEVVYDPKGVDHSHDNDPKTEERRDSTDSVKAVCEAVKAVTEKVIDSLTKRSDEPRGASEGQTEAHENDICEDPDTKENSRIDEIISGAFKEDGDAEEAFKESIKTAQDAGVPENDIPDELIEFDNYSTK